MPFPSAAYRQWIVDFYQDNKLVRDQLDIGGRVVHLRDIRCALLNVAASSDEIAPRPTTRAITQKTSSVDVTEILLDGGHVGSVVGRTARQSLWPRLADWLDNHD